MKTPMKRRIAVATRGFALVHLWLIVGLIVGGCAVSSLAQETPTAGMPVEGEVTWWPLAIDAPEGHIEIYQPQPETMKGDTLTARAAVSLTRPGATSATFGAVWLTAHVMTDRDTRTVMLRNMTINDVRLLGATATEQQDFTRIVAGQLSRDSLTFSLDQLMASLDTARCAQTKANQLATTPPHILFSTTPATLISVNGAPQLRPLDGQPGVSRVTNTPFILFFDQAGARYYLKAGERWVSAADLSGPWQTTTIVPPAITAAGATLVPPTTQPAAPTAAELAPAAADAQIIVATDPTELIVTAGNPQFTPVPGGAGGELLYATNTASDLFLDQADHRYYVLLSGRWYAAAALQGAWQYVASDHLSPAFAQIPADSPEADVLPFIAGTSEAHDAVLDAQIPQTADIRRTAGADLTVAYDGNPQFQDIPQSPGVAYALNTPKDVLRINGAYFCCHQAVWYASDTPTGPWTVCISVPREVYTLPPTCPLYHVQYVYAYDYSDNYVTYGYFPGYTGTYIYGPTIVYGTGYDYPGWDGTAYFPPPCTWGYGAYYDPFACDWGFDVGLYWGPVGWFGRPWHERWWRDHPDEHWGWHKWWGPGGFVHSHEIRSRLVDARAGGAFRNGDRGRDLAARLPGTNERGPGWNNLYARTGNAGRNISAAQLRPFAPARAAAGARNNVFTDTDGHIFRHSDAGWEEHNVDGPPWPTVNRVPEARPTYHPTSAYNNSFASPDAGLDRDFSARSRGDFRTSTIHSFGGEEFRGGGAFHGGGGGGGGHR